MNKIVRKVEEIEEMKVKEGKEKIIVKKGDEMINMVKRDMKKVEVMLKGRRRIVKKLEWIERRGIVYLKKKRKKKEGWGWEEGCKKKLLGIEDKGSVKGNEGVEEEMLEEIEEKEGEIKEIRKKIERNGGIELGESESG